MEEEEAEIIVEIIPNKEKSPKKRTRQKVVICLNGHCGKTNAVDDFRTSANCHYCSKPLSLKGFVAIRILDETSLSTVFKGFDQENTSFVVIRKFNEKVSEECCMDVQIEALQRVSQIPNVTIPKFICFFWNYGSLFIIEEFIDGYEVTAIVENDTLDEEIVIDILGTMLDILKKVHQKKVFHGNITPKSIVFHPATSKFFLTDFSSAAVRFATSNMGNFPFS